MKKLIILAVVIVVAVVGFVCFGPFTCDICGEDKFGSRETAEILGETVTYCEDCSDSLDNLSERLEDGLGELEDSLADLEDMF